MFSSSGHLWALGIGLTAACGVVISVGRVRAAADGPKGSLDRVAAVKHVMAGIHGPHCGGIGQLLKGEGPKEDKAWAELAMHAALLNESGHLLMQNGRCPDAVWADATAALRQGAAGVFQAAGKKDIKAAQESFKTVTASCQSCHARHKDKPAASAAVTPAGVKDAAPAVAVPTASPAPDRIATIRHLMAGISAPNCSGLGDALKSEGPRDDKGWQEVVRFAALLNEAGFLLLENRRCVDGVWKEAAANLREHSAKVVRAGTARNLEDARTSFQGVTAACGSCHQVHKKPAS